MHTSAHTQHLLAVDDNGVVPSPPLYFGHFLNHISDGLEVGAPSIGCPVGDMELSHLVSFLRLHKKNILIWTKYIWTVLTFPSSTLRVLIVNPFSCSSPIKSTVNSPKFCTPLLGQYWWLLSCEPKAIHYIHTQLHCMQIIYIGMTIDHNTSPHGKKFWLDNISLCQLFPLKPG